MHFTMANARRKVGHWLLERWHAGQLWRRGRPAETKLDSPGREPNGTPRPLEAALRAGRGFGSVRTSVLVAALEELQAGGSADAHGAERRQLHEAIERQLLRRGGRRIAAE